MSVYHIDMASKAKIKKTIMRDETIAETLNWVGEKINEKLKKEISKIYEEVPPNVSTTKGRNLREWIKEKYLT